MRKGKAEPEGNLVCMAEIVGVHGIKGMVKMKIFSDAAENLTDYAPLCDAEGREFLPLTLQAHQNVYLASFEGISDRTAAEKLKGTRLYVPRDRLPAIEDDKTFYHTDLIGLAAKDIAGNMVGKVITVANFGAGDLLEIKPLKGASYYLPFTDAAVPKVDLAAKEVTIDPPPGLLD